MKYSVSPLSLLLPLCGGIVTGIWFHTISVGVAVFALLCMPPLIGVYLPYAQDNPRQYWFKRKLYGWGWTPVTWQGWLLTVIYIGLMATFALTINENSPKREVIFTFLLPATLLTIAFIRLCYKKGESPRWQWGRNKEN